ncbi:MAG: pyridoxal phosphate-dependent aminotransferase [Sphingomonadales bacterium]|nr:pyridoxal phosphate-dependent aminotransferase [Sphingomonadales bacterium]
MAKGIPFTDIVRDLPATVPFVGPEALERRTGRPFALRIGANESAFGVSPKALEAIRQAAEEISWYGDPENFELREALAAKHGVATDEICVAGGIDSLLGLVVTMTVSPGTSVVTSLGGYPTFNYHVAIAGGALKTVPYRENHEDLDGLLEAVRRHGAPLVFLANPDNPMGTWHDAAPVSAFIEALPETTLLILDEAYIEFAPDGTAPPIDTAETRVIRMRTFSKVYGMAGARIGYCIGNKELIQGLNKVRSHFEVNRIAQAGALASLGDPEFVDHVIRSVEAGRRALYGLAERLGLGTFPSATNFVAIDMGSRERALATLAALQERGIFTRMPGVAPQDRCIRVTVGTPEQIELFAETFETALAESS